MRWHGSLPKTLLVVSLFLLITLVYATGAAGNNHAFAANSTHKVTDVTGTVTRVELTNVDLQAYSKYNADIQAISKNLLPISSISGNESSSPKEMDKDVYNKRAVRFLAKASPGSTISIRIQPESKLENYVATSLFLNRPYKIEGSQFDLRVKSQGGLLSQGLKNVKTRSYIVPQGADFIYVCWFHDYGEPNRPYWAGQVNYKDALKVEYYIFTSDEAFKKAYKIWTGKNPSGSIGASSSSNKESARNGAGNKESDEDSGDYGTIVVVGGGLVAAGALGFGAFKLFGGGGGAKGDAGTNPQYPQEPESFVYTDPATGAQTLYERDPNTGEWVDPTTGAVTDMSKLNDYTRQRAADRKWMDGQMDNLRNRNTATDRAWNQQDAAMNAEMQKTFDEIDHQGAREKAAIRSGTYGMSESQRIESQKKRQSLLESEQNAAHRVEKIWDAGTKVLEVTEKAADIAVDGLSVITEPVGGKLVADVYSGVKNVGKSTMEAAAKGGSIIDGIGEGLTKGATDIIQNHAGGSWKAKVATFVGSETGKEVVVAAIKGEDTVKAAAKGFSNGLFKYAVSEIGDNISAGVGQQNINAMKQHYKEINRVWNKNLSQKSVNKLTSMNFQKYFGKETTRELAQGFGQSMTKELGSATYDGIAEGKSVSESMFDDKW